MEMSQVRYVLAAARHLNFTRAAAEMNVSQPALTKAIRIFEGDLGSELFERRGRRLALTGIGTRILPHLEHILESVAAARALTRTPDLSDCKPVKVGLISPVDSRRLADFLSKFRQLEPGIDVTITESDLTDLKQQLLQGGLDACLISDPVDLGYAFSVLPLYTEGYVIILRPDHPIARKAHVALADLDGEPFVDHLSCEARDFVMASCRERGINLRSCIKSSHSDSVQAMVLVGLGIALLPESTLLAAGLTKRPLAEPDIARTVSLVTVSSDLEPRTAKLVLAMQAYEWT